MEGRASRDAGGRVPSWLVRVSGCAWRWLRVGESVFDVGCRGPHLMPWGGRPLLASGWRGGYWGRRSGLRGSPRPARPPTLRLGKRASRCCSCREGSPAACFAASPGGRIRGSHTGRGGWSAAWAAGRDPRAGFPCRPRALPETLGALPRGLSGPRPPHVAVRRMSFPAQVAAAAGTYGRLVPGLAAQK